MWNSDLFGLSEKHPQHGVLISNAIVRHTSNTFTIDLWTNVRFMHEMREKKRQLQQMNRAKIITTTNI